MKAELKSNLFLDITGRGSLKWRDIQNHWHPAHIYNYEDQTLPTYLFLELVEDKLKISFSQKVNGSCYKLLCVSTAPEVCLLKYEIRKKFSIQVKGHVDFLDAEKEQEIIEFANNFNFPEYDEESRKILLEQYDRVYKQHKKDKEFNRMYAQFKLNPLRRTEQRNQIIRSNRIENFLKDIKVHDDEYEAQFIQDLEDHMYE